MPFAAPPRFSIRLLRGRAMRVCVLVALGHSVTACRCRAPAASKLSMGSAVPAVTESPTATASSPSSPSGSESARPVTHSVPWPRDAVVLPVPDQGIFSDLDGEVRLHLPAWLEGAPAAVIISAPAQTKFVYVAGVAVGFAPAGQGVDVAAAGGGPANDADRDGIPDAVDILIGAKKTVLNAAAYRNTYRVLPYPGGDLPRTEGVCTDVVIRALRNAGLDLQQLVHEDIRAAPGAYPTVARPDRSIDHRRVRTLFPYLERHFTQLPQDPSDTASPYLPGDICLLDTLPTPGPDHIGLVSDRLGPSGLPLLVNNWTDGHVTAEMDLLDFVPVTHRFRVPVKPLRVVPEHRGADGLLLRRRIGLPNGHRQLLLVHATLWESSGGTLSRWTRASGADPWEPSGEPVPVRLGSAGLGWGRGLHSAAVAKALPGPSKREGDRRSPAGVFTLGTAFGQKRPSEWHTPRWPWRSVGPLDRYVDDPKSPLYNTWQVAPREGAAAWSSAERLMQYELGIVVEHNARPAEPGAGSAIFLHTWRSAETPTTGCTAMARPSLVELLSWLDSKARPVLVQVPGMVL